ncbi:MAG: cation:proton antiporter [Clostridia bacterium]|nr:cation:proton antiporter [Clostridia bacterium]
MDQQTIFLLLYLALAIAIGLVLTRLFKLIHIPNVTAYLVAGLLIGPYSFGIMPEQALKTLDLFSTIALGFIAFSIGFSFKIDNLKKLGGKIYTITVVQALFTALLVDLAMFIAYLFGLVELPLVFVFGAIATATAPAATLLVVKQYNAHGPVTDTLLPVVAIDDAIGLIVFELSLSVAKTIATDVPIDFVSVILRPLGEIGLSLAIGAGLGFVVAMAEKIFLSRANRLTIIILCVFTGVALSELMHLSSLLLCMSIGAVYCNFDKHPEKVMDVYDRWTHPLYVLFFVISGAKLDVRIIASVGIIGAIYLVVRSLGKYEGAKIGSILGKAQPEVKKYLGLTLLPQAGVAIGMTQIVSADPAMAAYAPIINTVVLSATLIYELVGPLITKWALTKAGEIQKELPKKPDSPAAPPTAPDQATQQ